MILMALDHVRVYSALPAGGPEPGLFLTRWVTHFCAPAFIFLAGTSLWLSTRVERPGVSRALVTRGRYQAMRMSAFVTEQAERGEFEDLCDERVVGHCQ